MNFDCVSHGLMILFLEYKSRNKHVCMQMKVELRQRDERVDLFLS